MNIQNYVAGQWVSGTGEEFLATDAITGEAIGTVSSAGIDYAEVLEYGRRTGGPALRKMTFQERGRMLKALALHLMKHKDKFYEVSFRTGATKVDSWIDIEGGIGNLFANASLRRQFPDLPYYVDGEAAGLSRNGTFIGHHIMVPKRGVAVHINAFNFPVWGMLEKIAVNLMAGVPAVVKPSEYTSYLTEVVVREIIASKILPEGSLQLITGLGRGILDDVQLGDTVTFTGSAATGKKLQASPQILERGVTFNLEADSLNASVLGEAAAPGTPEFDLFVKEVTREITVKAGQKCTAVRRILVPENYIEDVQAAVSKRLASTTMGDPRKEGVRMGSLATKLQVERVMAAVDKMKASMDMVYGGTDQQAEIIGSDYEKGAFMAPILFRNNKPLEVMEAHNIEAFGPVSTIMPYKNLEEAVEIANLGKGSLVSSIVTADDKEAREYVVNAAPMHGRILVLNEKSAKESTGHGSPMPLLTHGGPGRAGGGEEMGGKRGILHYLQRTAIQGHPDTITEITQVYQPGSTRPEADKHVFRKHFEELTVGETVYTAKHTVTVTDIVNFANVSGDNFYAHMDETSLEGTIFEGRVAHGYFILSKAAGLFVEAKKGPVLLNYGIDEARFTKPVYPGTTIGVKFTVKEKIDQEKRSEDDVAKGIVKFNVEVYDDTDETVAIATILTMVKKIDQSM
ncbi:phenylacetic acid degradation bifunctional protein PaaZ [Phaeocystidibacter marisrubri]|uniref:Phenylacetic acid degradation bifunctional protein PaaZ n=1 Tax=Phaeocystidibacter marisrubri TaxID=1577780 RepID=A0A6L3ZFK6_9FLAO|nr:phenylacetic acid degradation bifunctional protein PaaZ [Phaeocystidibacter marisrubri]KAB2816436.1 phenylacetic acid degradation bifunctional protein PaaZ [Phaeocystidibacter marisrubri]GGH69047.1 bifunctional aldehyde dehydrogenase/enoyl-CoA hydratase [Phaeocystidibacter marisrubri]